MALHTIDDLKQRQSLPLGIKVRMTQQRIREWVNEFGIDGVYVSFSGGKDSTVLLHIARQIYPDMKAVFVDTGLEYPEIREFVKTYENVEWLKPTMTFKQVIEKYGYPFISKEVAECVYGARKYLTELNKPFMLGRAEQSRAEQSVKYAYRYEKLCGIGRYAQTKNAKSRRRCESEASDNVGGASTEVKDGDYP
jgi:NH3-dependent NAD+ synthetase